MSSSRSDTTLIQRLKCGPDSRASEAIWERYFQRLVLLARKRLGSISRRARDEEDIALSAFDSFFRGLEKGHFPKLDDKTDLWQILVLLTERKAVSQIRRERAAKRGGGKVNPLPCSDGSDDSKHAVNLEDWSDSEPTPELAAVFTEECRRLFAALPDPELRVVALLKMESFTVDEIAKSLDRAPRSIERKLQTIRKIWRRDAAAE